MFLSETSFTQDTAGLWLSTSLGRNTKLDQHVNYLKRYVYLALGSQDNYYNLEACLRTMPIPLSAMS